MSLKGILEEELDNAVRLKKRYQKELSALPKGSLIRKKIKGHDYFYLVYRDEQNKVCFDYLGKDVSAEQKKKFLQIKKKRASYRESIAKLDKEIKFLRKSVRG